MSAPGSEQWPPPRDDQGGYGPPPGGPPRGGPPPGGYGPPPGGPQGAGYGPPRETGPKGPHWGHECPGPRSPLLCALLNIFCCFPVGHIYLGQSKKALMFFLFNIIASMTVAGSLIVWVICVIDGYQLAERMNRQGSVRALENGLDVLDQVFGPNGIIKP